MKRSIPLFVMVVISPLLSAQSLTSAQALLKEADAEAELYNWHAAAESYRQSEKAFRSLHDSRNTLYAHIGYLRGTMESANLPKLSAYFGAQADFAEAAKDAQLAMKCYIAKGDVDAEIDSGLAQTDWEQVLRIGRQSGNQRWVNRATGEIGFHRYVQGDHTGAKKSVASALLAAHKTDDFAAEIRFLSGIGTGLELAGATGEAHNYLDRALNLARKHPETGYPYMGIAGQIMTFIQENKLEPAAILIKDDISHSTADGKFVKLTQARLFLADVAIAQKKDDDAILVLQQTIEIAKHNGTRLLTEVYTKLANLYRSHGFLKQASEAYQAALADSDQNRDMYLAPELLLTLARLKHQLHEDAQAEKTFQRATDVIEGMLAHTTEVRTREALLTTMSKVYAEHFALDATRGKLEEAYRTIERVRGRIVAELLFAKPQNDDLEGRNQEVEQTITDLKLRLVTERSETSRQRLIDELFYADLRRWASRGQFPLSAIQKPTVSIADVKHILRPDEAMLEYVFNDDESYCLMISTSGLRLIGLPPRQTIETAISVLLSAIHGHQDPMETERRLFQYLIAPLGNLDQYRYLTIVPDATLHTLPFDVLSNPSGSYLGLQHAVSYTPSAGTEYLLRARQHSADPLFLGIGGVTYLATSATSKQPAARGPNDTEYDVSNLHDLPGSEEEIRTGAILLHLEPHLITGTAATKTELGKEDLSRYRVVHYAVHAIANSETPDNAALILRSDPPRNNGFVEVRDILRTRLNAALVVLSACDTAVGRVQGEGGIANLAQAFLIAGASSVVPTLWKVDDEYSLFLMKHFYTRLSKGEDKATALQGAKNDLVQTFGANTDPSFWAGFTLVGDATGRIQLNQSIASANTNDISHRSLQ